MVEVLQLKAKAWPKVASESTYEAQKFQNVLGEHPPDPPIVASAFRAASGLKLGGAWVRKRSVPTLSPSIGATPLMGSSHEM